MCGLAGFAGEGSVLQLGRMAASLHRRGPDDEGFFTTRNVGFAFRRLSVIDLETGHQPVANEDGTIHAMLNGEIYNFKELRSELQVGGHRFKTGSDSEVMSMPTSIGAMNAFQNSTACSPLRCGIRSGTA